MGNEIERTSMRKAARSEAERWGWAGATKQLKSYYEDVLDKKTIKYCCLVFTQHEEVEWENQMIALVIPTSPMEKVLLAFVS